MSFWVIILAVTLLDIITARGIRRMYPQYCLRRWRAVRNAFIIQACFAIATVCWGIFLRRYVSDYRIYAWHGVATGVAAVIYIPKCFFVMCLLFDRVFAYISKLHRRHCDKWPRDSRQFVAKSAFWLMPVVAALVVWGMLFGRYQFKVQQVDVYVDDLPAAFHGYKIVQISDVHAGSFAGSAHRFSKAVELINGCEANLIVFTGDMVNNFSAEATPLIPVFSQLKAMDGKYAVLGNHDFGGYFRWTNPADSAADHHALVRVIEQMGFELLNNRAKVITRYNSDRMALIGVENWGAKKRHTRRADLWLAMDSIHHVPFKVLLSHDPSFWAPHVHRNTDIALTLSGHTHGLQMGIKLGNRRYAPAFLFGFREWAGLYRAEKQQLYVNCGLGVIGFPGRIGVSPEITEITLWKTKSAE